MFYTYVLYIYIWINKRVNYSVVNLWSPKSQMKHVLQQTSLTPFICIIVFYLVSSPEFDGKGFIIRAASSLKIIDLPEYYLFTDDYLELKSTINTQLRHWTAFKSILFSVSFLKFRGVLFRYLLTCYLITIAEEFYRQQLSAAAYPLAVSTTGLNSADNL